jgi:hypothetical protein
MPSLTRDVSLRFISVAIVSFSAFNEATLKWEKLAVVLLFVIAPTTYYICDLDANLRGAIRCFSTLLLPNEIRSNGLKSLQKSILKTTTELNSNDTPS